MEKATPLKISINGQDMLAEVKSFSTGSFGWYLNGKTVIEIDGTPVQVQLGLNLTIIGSKELPGDHPTPPQTNYIAEPALVEAA